MEVDFDKEIDAMLRNLAKGNSFAETVPKSHLDADELSAFAENVLPAKARLRATEHLADCPKCRKFLANFVLLAAEAESETIHEEAKIVAVIPAIPWYRKLFAFPQLAYTMGAFALLLSGMVGYLVLQNSQKLSPTVAQMEKSSEKTTGTGGASSEGEGQIRETYSNTANTAANVAMPAANVSANSNVSTANVSVSKEPGQPLATPAPASEVTTGSGPPPAEKADELSDRDAKNNKDTEAKKGGEVAKSEEAPKSTVAADQPTNEVADNNVSQKQVQELPVQGRNQSNIMMPDGQSGKNAPVPASPRKTENRREGERQRADDGYVEQDKEVAKVAKKKQAEPKPTPAPSISVGGKTFRKADGIWIDNAYKGGSTKNVKRGTDEYKKLDSDLQSIGNSFKETVIVVWSGKNYKIQ